MENKLADLLDGCFSLPPTIEDEDEKQIIKALAAWVDTQEIDPGIFCCTVVAMAGAIVGLNAPNDRGELDRRLDFLVDIIKSSAKYYAY